MDQEKDERWKRMDGKRTDLSATDQTVITKMKSKEEGWKITSLEKKKEKKKECVNGETKKKERK